MGALKELALAMNDEESRVFKKIFDEAKEIYLQSKNIDQDKPYQFLSFIRLFSKF